MDINKPVPITGKNRTCVVIALQDQFHDGWGTAFLSVESPGGVKDVFHQQCTAQNPETYLFCPVNEANGVYKFRIENGDETPFGWEIHWRVSVNSKWYRGDRHTALDFVWNDKYDVWEEGAQRGVLPLLDTCEICSATKPEGKHRSLSNLRSLHHKSTTSSPTVSRSPTLTIGTSNTDYWNQFRIFGNAAVTWFNQDYLGAYFWVSNSDGSKLFQTGTGCTSTPDIASSVVCWVELPDGDYKLRVGKSVSALDTYRWKFCQSPDC